MKAPSRWALLLLTVAVACESPPATVERSLNLDLPQQWLTALPSDAIPAAPWWVELHGGALEPLVSRALANNPDLVLAAARVSEARALAALRSADLLPSLQAGLDGARTKRNFVGLPVPGGSGVRSSRFSTYELSLAASWELDLWGRLAARENQAVATAEQAFADLLGVRLSLVGAVLRAAFLVLEADAQLALARSTADSWRENQQLVNRRYQQGLAPALARRQVDANLAGAQARVPERERLAQQSRLDLSRLMGELPDLSISAGSGFPVLSAPPPSGLPASVLGRRPDLLAAERALAAAGFGAEAARGDFYPRLLLTGAVGTSSDQLSDLLDGDFSVWSIAGSLVQPVFQGGRLTAAAQLADARADAALAQFTGTLLTALTEVESALLAERWLVLVEADLVSASVAASSARELSRSRYRSGLSDLLTLLDAERVSQAAESELISVRRARLDARVALHLALGGGLDAAAELALWRAAWVHDLLPEEPSS